MIWDPLCRFCGTPMGVGCECGRLPVQEPNPCPIHGPHMGGGHWDGETKYGMPVGGRVTFCVPCEEAKRGWRWPMARPKTREVPLEPPSEWRGTDVRLLRRHLGISQATLARILAVDRCSVTGWERGARQPPAPACRLLDILDSHPEAFGEGIRG